jgi:uncharacterized protein
MTAAGLIAGPFQGLVARSALAAQGGASKAGKVGYGPLLPIPDKTDGEVRLLLPDGFQYRSFTGTGEMMSDGVLTPGRHDGMAAFNAGRGRIRLVRNQEINNPGPAFGDAARAYDPMARGGTTTVEVSAHGEHVASWVSLNGTQMNCAGGAMPWGSWITCEETVNGPDVGPDFTGASNEPLQQRHGYVFDVPSAWGLGEHEVGVPIRSAGRFAHEAVALDPVSGFLYETEDDFNFPSGFYRYRPPAHPVQAGRLLDGGQLEMLRVVGQDNAELTTGQTVGVELPVDWVTIDEPDFTGTGPGYANDDAIQFVSQQGLAQGAARFSRLEGLFYADRRMYIVSTQGGDAPGSPGAGYGDGFGQVWVYDCDASTLTLLFESPGKDVLDLPDNVAVSPRGGVLLCEDGNEGNYLRGLTQDGELFDFALNQVAGRINDEFAGATFSPNGQTLFVNVQASVGLTFAIWGPWGRGAL